MAQTVVKLQAKLMKEYYRYFSKYAKGKTPDQKTAWVTAFTPVEILEALGISYYYPESYAAVIAASGKEQALISAAEQEDLSRDCCSYSCCFNGCLSAEGAPRGTPPKPDILIATNNQCNTLPNWWNVLAHKFHVPLIVLDYPGESVGKQDAIQYVTQQHKQLITALEALSGNRLELGVLAALIENSVKSVSAWKTVAGALSQTPIQPTRLFDDINFLITARCKEETAQLYQMMADELGKEPRAESALIPIFWLGYPLWYHPERYLPELLKDFRVVGSNYITWWELDYSGCDVFEQLFHAYNYTFLNLSQKERNSRLSEQIKASGAVCAVTLHNKSCKCDFVSARNVDIPQVELEIDMIDRTFLDLNRAKKQIDLLKETVCTI